MKIVILFLHLSLLAFSVSCQKQKAPILGQQEIRRIDDIERLKACTDVNFNHGVLLYQNALLLFKCTKWDTDFPYMFKAMQEISADSWNQLISPINESYLENQERKNKFFKSIHDLDNKGGLEDLSYVIAALNESNFFDAIRSMFQCMDNPGATECLNRQERIPSRRSIKQILHVFDLSPEIFEQNLSLMSEISAGVEPLQEQLRAEVNKFKSIPAITSLKIRLIDEFYKKLQEGLKDSDRVFLPNILLTGGSDKQSPWIYEWLQDEKLSREKFRDLLEYPSITNPAFLGEIRGLKAEYNSNFNCTILKDASPNELIKFDFSTHLNDYVSVITSKNYKSFYDFSAADVVGLKVSSGICRELEENQYGVNFIRLITDVSDFMKEKKNYDLVKYLITKTSGKYDQKNGFAENLYFLDFLAGNMFLNSNNLAQEILKATRGLYPVVYDIAKNFPASTYLDAGLVAQEVLKKDYDHVSKGLADYWLFLNTNEKNYLFNFIDHHFDKDVKYVMLLNFYIKILSDYREVRPIFQQAWTANERQEELTMLSLQDFVKHMSGTDALNDFKKFFSRNQIIKVLEVLSSGQQIADKAKEELNYRDSTKYIFRAKSEKYIIQIPYDPGKDESYMANGVVECMRKFSEVKNGLYDLVKNFPLACQKVTADNIAFRMFGWMNSIEEDYMQLNKSDNPATSLFDKEGLLGPYMINSQIGLLKIIDSIVGPYLSSGHSNGLEYLIRSANYHMNTAQAAPLLEKNIFMLNQWQTILPEKNILYRNALIKTLTLNENFSNAKNVFYRIGKLFEDYGQWVRSGEWKKTQERDLGKYDARNDCKNIINQHVSPNPCPKVEDVKKTGSDILYLMANIWEQAEGSPVALLIQGVKAGEGLAIPLDGLNSKKYRMSLDETFRFLYDTTDRTLEINNKKTLFTDVKGKAFNDSITTLERIETVIREVSFRNNYLGVSYLNHVVAGDNYNTDVQGRKSILSKCIQIPYERCGRRMSDSDIRMTYNALGSYDALLDANNGRGVESRFKFGDYLKTFQQTLVGSSAKAAQEVAFFPLSDEILLKHNGKVLSDLTLLSALSNAGRVIRDRVGRTRADFSKFINSASFKRVDRTLMNDFNIKNASISAEKLFVKMREKHVLDDGIDWLASLDYDQLRLVEDTIARLLVISSYLGTPDIVFEKNDYNKIDERYKKNSIFQLFLASEKIIDYWPSLKKYFPADAKLIDVIKPVNTALVYLTAKLESSTDPEQNIAYRSLNDIVMVLQTVMFDDLLDARIAENDLSSSKGLDFALELLNTPEKLDFTVKTTRENYRYTDVFYKGNSEWFLSIGQNLQRLSSDPKLDLIPLRDYLGFTSKNSINMLGDKVKQKNYHYDEVGSILKYLGTINKSGESNLILANKKLFLENIDQVIQMITDIFPAIKIQEIHPPLVL